MRLKAEIWVKAYIRSCSVAGAMAVVVRHGDDDAGAIFIKVSRLDGTASLYGPAFAGFEGAESDRRWAKLIGDAPEYEVDERLTREHKFDSDLWIVEVEDRGGRHFLGDWLTVEAASK